MRLSPPDAWAQISELGTLRTLTLELPGKRNTWRGAVLALCRIPHPGIAPFINPWWIRSCQCCSPQLGQSGVGDSCPILCFESTKHSEQTILFALTLLGALLFSLHTDSSWPGLPALLLHPWTPILGPSTHGTGGELGVPCWQVGDDSQPCHAREHQHWSD